MTHRYELRIQATGEVRDADGNLIEQIPVDNTIELTEDQVRSLTQQEES